MGINTINGTPPPAVRGVAQQERAGASTLDRTANSGPQASSGGRGADEVRLTEHSVRLRELQTSLSEEPAVDGARVEKLRQAIASGEYRVDTARLAGKLLGFEDRLFR